MRVRFALRWTKVRAAFEAANSGYAKKEKE